MDYRLDKKGDDDIFINTVFGVTAADGKIAVSFAPCELKPDCHTTCRVAKINGLIATTTNIVYTI